MWAVNELLICSGRRRRYDDISVSIQEHIDERTEELMEEGMPRDEAEQTARREFGNVTLLQERSREVWQWQGLESLLADLKHVCRRLLRSPGFAITVVLTLAIGIGANTAVFSVLNSVLLRPLPYPEPEQLVSLRLNAPGAPGLAEFRSELRLSASMYLTFAAHNRCFQSMGVWGPGTASITGLAQPEQVNTALISGGVLETSHVPARRRAMAYGGRPGPTGAGRVMLSYGYWQRRFGGDPAVVGRTISVNSQPRVIAGVMPRGFKSAELRLRSAGAAGARSDKELLAGFAYHGIARLRPGVTIPQADADVARLLNVWMDSWTNANGQRSALVFELEDYARLAAAERYGSWQHPDRALGGDGNHRRGDADCVHQRGQPVAGASRCAPAGACGALGAGRGAMADCAGAAAGERDAGPAGRSSGRGRGLRRAAVVDGDRAGRTAAPERDLARRLVDRFHA